MTPANPAPAGIDGPCHVLLIEDEWLVGAAIEMTLEAAGASSIDCAATEREALVLAANRAPDVIVSDIQLAEGLGTSAVASIRTLHGDIPVIFVTGSPEMLDGIEAVAILPKPYLDTDLAEAFVRARRSRSGAG